MISRPTRFVISSWLFRYSITVSSGEARRSCFIYTITECSVSSMIGAFSLHLFIASNAVFSPSPTSLFGAFGNLLIILTILGFLADCESRIFSTVT